MSTHAALGVKFSDGSILGCYVHFDGASITPRLVDYLKKNTTTGLTLLISEAQGHGGIRSFHCPTSSPIEMPPETEFLDDDEPYVITKETWNNGHMGASYRYLVDYETGTVWSEAGEY